MYTLCRYGREPSLFYIREKSSEPDTLSIELLFALLDRFAFAPNEILSVPGLDSVADLVGLAGEALKLILREPVVAKQVISQSFIREAIYTADAVFCFDILDIRHPGDVQSESKSVRGVIANIQFIDEPTGRQRL